MEFKEIQIAKLQGGVFHPKDFLYAGIKEEIAAKVQTLIYDRARERRQEPRYSLDIDTDGDISLQETAGSSNKIFLAADRIVWNLVRIPAKTLQNESDHPVKEVASFVWELFRLRERPALDKFGLKFSLAFPLREPLANKLLGEFYQQSLLDQLTVFGQDLEYKSHQFAPILKSGNLVHQIHGRSSDDDGAIILDLDTQLSHSEDPTATYPDFVEKLIPLAVTALAKLSHPILQHEALDVEYLRRGTKE